MALVYIAVARYSVLLHDLAGLGAVFWPGAGVTLTALLVSPRRSWPAILVAVGTAEVGNDLLLGYGWWPALWWAAGNMAEPLAAALLIQHWQADGFDDVQRTLRFVVATAAAATLGGLVGAIGTSAGVSPLPYAVLAGQWLIGDGLGILTVVPFGLVLLGWIPSAGLRSPEGVLALTTVTFTAMLLFGGPAGATVVSDYVLLLPMVWAAVRLGVAGSAAALFLAAQISNAYNAIGEGPFGAMDFTPVQRSAHLQVFLASVGVTTLLLGSRTVESKAFHDLAEARRQLIAAVSHELRTPLTPIVGFSESLLMQSRALDGPTRQGLEVIQRNSRHLTILIEDLLQASRARRGTLPVHPEDIEVVPFVAGLLHDRHDDDVEMVLHDPDVRAWADPIHVTQILTNLIDNARRYGRPPVHLEVTSDGVVTELAVTDHGDGVPAWFVPHLFDEFAQAHDGDRRPTLGLGLGLPIARDLADANGSDLAYVSTEEGARFVLTLPATAPPHDHADSGP